MITMHCVHFGGEFQVLADALEESVRRNFPAADLQMWRCPPPPLDGLPAACAHNAEKLRLWERAFLNTQNETILIDADTLVMDDLSSAFDQSYDVAYTERPDGSRHRLNGGVVFLRPTDRARDFMRRWVERDDALVASRPVAGRASHSYGGVNQASLCELLDSGGSYAETVALPCGVWNSVDETWASFGEHTKVLHIKSALRRAAIGTDGGGDEFWNALKSMDPKHEAKEEALGRLASIWRSYTSAMDMAA